MKVITIGRSSNNDIIIEDVKVSRVHLQLVQNDGGDVSVVDLNSANGTYVNGQRINGEVHLHPNDTIRIGDTNIQWQKFFMSPVLMPEESVESSTSSNSPESVHKPNPQRHWLWIAICSALFLAGGLWLYISQNKKAQRVQESIRQEYEAYEERLHLEAEQKETLRMQDKADDALFREELREDRDKSKALAAKKQKEAEQARKQADDANKRMTEAEAAMRKAESESNEANIKMEQAIAAQHRAEIDAAAAKKAVAEAKQAEEAIKHESNLSIELTTKFYSEEYEYLNKQTAKRACVLLEKEVPKDKDAKAYLKELFNDSDNKGKKDILDAIHTAKQSTKVPVKVDSLDVATTVPPTDVNNH